MYRLFCGLSLSLLALGAARAQEPDYSKVEIKTTQLAPNLYLLQGGGGNVTASVGADGTLIVDDEPAPLAEKIRAALVAVGATKPVRFVINTHYHFDHTGGNLAFSQAGATIIATHELRSRLEKGGAAGNGGSIKREMKPADPGALPVITFSHDLTVHMNGEAIHPVHYLDAHTDGDSVVFFPQSGAVAMGDIYVRYGFPFIDMLGGGSVQGMIRACEDVLRSIDSKTKVIPGHGELANVADLREYLKMLRDTTAAVARGLKAGKSLEQMKKENVLGRWSERYAPPNAFVNADAFTESIYLSLIRRSPKHGGTPG